jgi:hypothetical protein
LNWFELEEIYENLGTLRVRCLGLLGLWTPTTILGFLLLNEEKGSKLALFRITSSFYGFKK